MARRLILFGAFDRHNFGDLLLAHCAAAAQPERAPLFAGLLARDLRAFDGHRVRALGEILATSSEDPGELLHVGGEILTTTAWEAAVMLQSPAGAAQAISAFDRNWRARLAWATRVLKSRRRIPYVVGGADLPPGWRTGFRAVGGVAFGGLRKAQRAEVLRALRSGDALSVRDRVTQTELAAAGVAASLVPDPAAATRALFGTRIAQRATCSAVAAVRRRMPRWLALQLAAEWGDDATLAAVAAVAVATARRLEAGIVLFRAGLAPWHDDAEVLDRLAARIAADGPDVALIRFGSAAVFDICALLANAAACVGTSLHSWIVATSFDVPARCLVRSTGAKPAAYIDTWADEAPRQWISRSALAAMDGGGFLA